MVKIIERVYKSRKTIIDIYKDYEWDTESVPEYSMLELEQMFSIYNTSDQILDAFGDGMAFTMKIKHKFIENHNLVVIYYNLSNESSKSSKINKSIIEKINQLYTTDYINHDDSLLILTNENNNDSMEKINNNVSHKIKQDYEISEELEKYIYSPENDFEHARYNKNYFRKCIILGINYFQVNLLKHELVPKHNIIYENKKKQEIFEKYNTNKNQMPILNRKDIIAKIIRINPDDICEIVRHSKKCGQSLYYRYCR